MQNELYGIGDGSARRDQIGENEYKLFEKKSEPILEHNYLGMILDAQSNIRVAIDGLKQRQRAGTLSLCGELILLELDIELSLLKLKNIAVGRNDIIK